MSCLALISRLPLRVLYVLADFLYLIANHVVAYRKDVVYQNLRNTYPTKSESELRQIADGFYHHLCDLLVESLKAMSISAQELRTRVKLNGIEIIEDYLLRDQAVILMVAHQCNLEWLLLASGLRLGQPVHVVYKPLHDKLIDRLMLKTRSRFGGKPVPARDVFLGSRQEQAHYEGRGVGAGPSPATGGGEVLDAVPKPADGIFRRLGEARQDHEVPGDIRGHASRAPRRIRGGLQRVGGAALQRA